jgi:hypothetical protein
MKWLCWLTDESGRVEPWREMLDALSDADRLEAFFSWVEEDLFLATHSVITAHSAFRSDSLRRLRLRERCRRVGK